MRSFIAMLLLVLFAASSLADSVDEKVIAKLLSCSYTVRAGNAQGSCVVTAVGDTSYAITAAHVVANLRSTDEVIDPRTGIKRTLIKFNDPEIIREYIEDGRKVSEERTSCEVLTYSNAETGHDIAVLRVRKKNFTHDKVPFYLDQKLPPVGSKLMHVGSFLGQSGANSYSAGVLSQVGRVYLGQTYLQTNCTAYPGSSGGGVWTEDGRWCGMVTRGSGSDYNLCVGVGRLKKWLQSQNMLWLIDPAVKPSDVKPLIEDPGFLPFPAVKLEHRQFKFWLYED